MKKRLSFVIIVLSVSLMLMPITACNREPEEEEIEIMIPIEKVSYGDSMGFEFRFFMDGEIHSAASVIFLLVHPSSQDFDPSYTELIFVHSEEEAAGFPDNIIAAWPTDLTDGIIVGLHWAVAREEDELEWVSGQRRRVISLEDFDLTYPLTPADLVDDWEKVQRLWNSLPNIEQSHIRDAAPLGGIRE